MHTVRARDIMGIAHEEQGNTQRPRPHCGQGEKVHTMKRYYMRDAYNTEAMSTTSENATDAANEFFYLFGYFPDVIKEIDEGGATIRVIKDA